MTPETDELMRRLRAADPAAALPPAPLPDRAAVERARRGRAHRHLLRGGVAATALALAASAALALGPRGPLGGNPVAPTVSEVVAHAIGASTMPAGSIGVVESEKVVRWDGPDGPGGLEEHTRNWLQLRSDGTYGDSRTLRLDAKGESMPPGLDTAVSFDADGRPTTRTYLPGRGIRVDVGAEMVPSALSRSQEALRRAQRHDDDVPMREEVRDGRRVFVLTVTGFDDGLRPLPGDRAELVVDAETYEPVSFSTFTRTRINWGRDKGEWATHELEERVVSVRWLPDTAENRRFLEVRGPAE